MLSDLGAAPVLSGGDEWVRAPANAPARRGSKTGAKRRGTRGRRDSDRPKQPASCLSPAAKTSAVPPLSPEQRIPVPPGREAAGAYAHAQTGRHTCMHAVRSLARRPGVHVAKAMPCMHVRTHAHACAEVIYCPALLVLRTPHMRARTRTRIRTRSGGVRQTTTALDAVSNAANPFKFEKLPSTSAVCTYGITKARLWCSSMHH